MAQIVQEQFRLRISAESLVYIPILLLTLAIRVIMLDAVPLDNAQAHEALAALHRIDPAVSSFNPDAPLLPDNALGALFNSISLLVFGSNDAAARLATALAGTFLVLSPLLYRRYVGRTFALFLSLALMVSPVAIVSARTMSGLTWAMLLVMIGGWLTLQFVETRQRWLALGASVCAAGILFLTTPYGIFVILGLLFGISLASLTTNHETTRQVAVDWPYFESFMAILVTIIVVSTAFLTVPAGLSSAGQVLEQFVEGLTERQPNTPFAYGLLVTLRYEIGWLIFALIAIWFTWRDGTFLERFFTGWLLWSLICVTVYPGATADIALLVTVPAAALTASLATRMTREVSFGFWEVPDWFIPVHAVVVAALIAALTVSVQSLTLKLYEEAKVQPFAKVLDFGDGAVRIGTIDPDSDSSMVINLPHITLVNCKAMAPDDPRTAILVPNAEGLYCEENITRRITVQIKPLDESVEDASFVIRSPAGQIVYGPEKIGDELLTVFSPTERGEYRFDVVRGDAEIETRGQYLALVYLNNLTVVSGFDEVRTGAFVLRFPEMAAALRIFARDTPNPAAIIVVPIVLLMLPISFFLGGALYGARAAWRGMGFGVMLAVAIFGLSLGWNTSTLYAGESRELWTQDTTAEDYHTLQDVLKDMSRRATGTDNEIEVTVHGEADGALAWALRNYSNARYVDVVGAQVTTPAVITRDVRPTLGADYVGQQLVFGDSWNRDSLNWTDFGSWWFKRRTRFEPQPADLWRLWVTKDVYDVLTVPEG